MRNRDTETDICSKRCLVWKLEPINKSQNQVHHHEKVRDSTLQNSTLHNWFRHVPSCWFGHVPTQLTMDSTEDTAVFNAVDGKRAVNECKAMQWTMQPNASGVEWWSKWNSKQWTWHSSMDWCDCCVGGWDVSDLVPAEEELLCCLIF